MDPRTSAALLGSLCAVTLGAAFLPACHSARELPPAREYTEPSTHPESPPELRRLRASLQALPDRVEVDERKRVLGRRLTPYDRSIDTHVSNLRRKLGLGEERLPEIRSVRGAGYVLTAQSEEAP